MTRSIDYVYWDTASISEGNESIKGTKDHPALVFVSESEMEIT